MANPRSLYCRHEERSKDLLVQNPRIYGTRMPPHGAVRNRSWRYIDVLCRVMIDSLSASLVRRSVIIR